MRVFTDLHHGSLFHSIQLMGRRVGFDVFRPVGMEWFHEEFFGLAEPYGNAIETVEQYLKIDNLSPVIHDAPAFNNFTNEEVNKSGLVLPFYEFNDYAHHTTNLGITLEAFKNIKIDVVIASIPQHLQKFYELRNKYQPQAKLIFQIGNPYWQLPLVEFYPNILDSCNLNIPSQYHKVTYHQEFETDIFYPQIREFYEKPYKVYSFVIFPQRLELFFETAKLLPDYEFRAFGHHNLCTDPPITGIKNIAEKMHEARFGWHDKDVDGYGHIFHNWFACARPVIAGYQGYAGRLGAHLFHEGYYTYNIDQHSPQEIAEWIKQQEDTLLYEDNCIATAESFKAFVNFEKEGEELKKFFSELR